MSIDKLKLRQAIMATDDGFCEAGAYRASGKSDLQVSEANGFIIVDGFSNKDAVPEITEKSFLGTVFANISNAVKDKFHHKAH